MLEFRLGNKNFALDESSKVRLNWKNPVCTISEFPGDLGMGIEIPVNNINSTILGNPERFERNSIGRDREFDGFQVRFNGYRLMSGTLIVNSANKETYSCWLRSHLGNLGKKHREKYINEMPWLTKQTFIYKPSSTGEKRAYSTPMIHNPAFWEGKGRMTVETTIYEDEDGNEIEQDEEIEYLTKLFRDENGYRVNDSLGGDGLKVNEGSVISPMLNVSYILEELLRMSGWGINKNDWAGEPAERLLLYNNFNIVMPRHEYEKVKRYVWVNGRKIEIVNAVITRIVWEIGDFDYKDLIPRIKFKDFILGLQNYLNYVFYFREDKKVDIVDRNAVLDKDTIDINEFLVSEWQIGEKTSRRLKFTCNYDENDGYQGDNWQDLTSRLDDFKPSVETHEDLLAIEEPQFGEIRMVRSENKVYEWKWGVNTNETVAKLEPGQEDILEWVFISPGPQPYLYGEGETEEEIETCFSTLVMDPAEVLLDMPIVKQHGNIGSMRSTWNDFSPRIFFDTYFGGNIKMGYALNWDGEDGLIAQRWNHWARFWKDRLPVESSFYFPVNVIDFVKNNIVEPFRTRHGKFIIEEMETEFELNRIGVTKIRGYKA